MNDLKQSIPAAKSIRLLSLACLCALAWAVPCFARAGGTIVDNGGDELTCVPDAALKAAGGAYFEGNYTLDYVVTYDPRFNDTDDADLPTDSWTEQRARLEAFIADKMPAALASFQHYANLLESSDQSQDRVWKASALDLSILDDQDLIQQLPSNCMQPGANGKPAPRLTQMVRRREFTTDTTRQVQYFYDYARFHTMLDERPALQLSYLVVHEWLWDYTDVPWINRTINHMLHSRASTSLSRDAFAKALKDLGISVDATGTPGPQGPKEAEIRDLFTAESVCDIDQRYTKEVFAFDKSNRIVVGPGQTQTFEVTVPDGLLPTPYASCGFAFVMSYRATGDGDATFSYSLDRGLGHFQKTAFATLVPTTAATYEQSYDAGLCQDDRCINRVGTLADLVTYKNFASSKWQLTVTNTGTAPGGGNVEILDPYFLFVTMRTP